MPEQALQFVDTEAAARGSEIEETLDPLGVKVFASFLGQAFQGIGIAVVFGVELSRALKVREGAALVEPVRLQADPLFPLAAVERAPRARAPVGDDQEKVARGPLGRGFPRGPRAEIYVGFSRGDGVVEELEAELAGQEFLVRFAPLGMALRAKDLFVERGRFLVVFLIEEALRFLEEVGTIRGVRLESGENKKSGKRRQ